MSHQSASRPAHLFDGNMLGCGVLGVQTEASKAGSIEQLEKLVGESTAAEESYWLASRIG
jgi:hypothetical protein